VNWKRALFNKNKSGFTGRGLVYISGGEKLKGIKERKGEIKRDQREEGRN